MLREFKVEANVGKPQVAYRETVRKRVEKVVARFVRQTGGSRPVRPRRHQPRAGSRRGLRLREQNPRRRHPRRIHRPPNRGCEEALGERRQGRLPDGRRKRQLVDGSYHDVDSSEMAFKIAGSMAIKEAAKANPVLLEPVMAVEVVTPEDFLGDVIGDLSRRRGKVQGQDQRGNALAVQAFVPLGRNVRLRDRSAILHPGPRHVHDAVRAVRGGPPEHRGRDRRARTGRACPA